MRMIFSGVGEAFDETLPNTSILLEGTDGESLLLDCGFTAASAFWSAASRPLDLGAVCLSHFHADHWFGLPALLARFVEEGRRSNLTIVGPEGVEEQVRTLMELAYPKTMQRAGFSLRFLTSAPDRIVDAAGFRLRFAAMDHSAPCLAVRARQGGRDVFYSGDGRPTPESAALARGCDVVVHEAFCLEGDVPGHGTVDGAVEFARAVGAETLALVHLQRDVRRNNLEKVRERLRFASDLRGLLPEPGDRLFVGR